MSITIKFHRIITYSQYIDLLYFTIVQYYLQLLWSNSSQPPIEVGEFLLDKVKAYAMVFTGSECVYCGNH